MKPYMEHLDYAGALLPLPQQICAAIEPSAILTYAGDVSEHTPQHG